MSGIEFKTETGHLCDAGEDSALLLRPGMGTLSYGPPVPVMGTWEGLQAHVRTRLASLRAAVASDGAMSVGLHLSTGMVDALAEPGRRRQLVRLLQEARLWAVGVDGSRPTEVLTSRGKVRGYNPDWRQEDRLHYTMGLAELLAEIAPEGRSLTVSTAPGAERDLATSREALDDIADGMMRAAAYLCALERHTGRRVALAVEPTPFGLLETTAEAAGYFEARLLSSRAERRFASLADVPKAEAADLLRRYLGVCYDTAHASVMDEDPASSLALLRRSGVPVHRLQLSVVPVVSAPPNEALEVLRSCDLDAEPVAAIGVDASGAPLRIRDLATWLTGPGTEVGRGGDLHFRALLRMPVSADRLGPIATSRPFVTEILAEHRARPITADIQIMGGERDKVPEALWGASEQQTARADLEWVRGRLG